MSFIVVVRRLRVRILTSVFSWIKSRSFFCCMHRWFSRFSFSYMNLDFVCVWEVQSTKIFGHCWVLRPSQNQSTFRLHDFFFQTSSTYHSWASSGTAGFSLYVNHSLISQGMTWKVALFSLDIHFESSLFHTG